MDFSAWLQPIVVAIVTGLFAYAGTARSSKSAHDKTIIEMKAENEKHGVIIEAQISEVKNDIRRLEAKQDKHNGLIERVYKLETTDAVILQRLSDMEAGGKKRAGA